MIRSITDTRRTTACMALLSLCVGLYLSNARASSPIAFDVDRAIGICDSSALDNLEGIWIYPDDNVTVTVFRNDSRQQYSLPEYDITVVHSPTVLSRRVSVSVVFPQLTMCADLMWNYTPSARGSLS